MRAYFFSLVLTLTIFCADARGNGAIVLDGNAIMDQSMEENLCALTFDDGPSPYTVNLLRQLEENGIKATFFLLGSNVAHYPDIVESIKNAGHEIGNHSWSHPNLRYLSAARQKDEILRTDALLRSHGITPLYIRPPYGAFDEHTIAIAKEIGSSLLLWSLDSLDWKHLPTDYAKLLSTRGTVYEEGNLRGIFLFHDIHKGTVEDLPRILDNLRAGGCDKFVTVNEYLKGLTDPEPAMVMTRRPPAIPTAQAPMYPASDDPVPFARCSQPRSLQAKQQPAIDLESVHAQAPRQTSLMEARK